MLWLTSSSRTPHPHTWYAPPSFHILCQAPRSSLHTESFKFPGPLVWNAPTHVKVCGMWTHQSSLFPRVQWQRRNTSYAIVASAQHPAFSATLGEYSHDYIKIHTWHLSLALSHFTPSKIASKHLFPSGLSRSEVMRKPKPSVNGRMGRVFPIVVMRQRLLPLCYTIWFCSYTDSVAIMTVCYADSVAILSL